MDKDDAGGISGTVSSILSQFTIASAAASADEELVTRSEALLTKDFMTSVSNSDYELLVEDTMLEIDAFLQAVPETVSSNFNSFTSEEFPYGFGISVGFDANKKVVSVQISNVDASGSYKFNDPASGLTSFYKLSFALNNGGNIKYRQSYVFNKGKSVKANVTYASSAASIKVSEALFLDDSISISQMESRQKTYASEISLSSYSNAEADAVSSYVTLFYNQYNNLNPIQKTLLESSILHALRSNATLGTAMIELKDDFDAYMESGGDGGAYTLAHFASETGGNADLIVDTVSEVIARLVSMGLIPPISMEG